MKTPKILTGFDILSNNKTKERKKRTIIENGYIVFIHNKYEIDLKRCSTHQEILAWVHHLVGKFWITPDLIEDFIELTTQYHRIEIYKA